MTRRTAFFFDEHCMWHSAGQYALTMPVGGWVQPPAAGGLAESPETKRRLKSLMEVSGLLNALDVRSASCADEALLESIHSKDYLDRFRAMSHAGGGELGDNAPIGPGSYEIARRSVGLAIEAVATVLRGETDNAYALTRPPGHHCLPNQAMGFCFLANIPIAIEAAKRRFAIERVAVIDWDVHHGNGTQAIYYDREDVLTISLHQEGCFPPGYAGDLDRGEGEGEDSNLNIPLLPGGGEDAYRYALERLVVPALERFSPELIIVACGYDANALDPLARMLLPSEAFRDMTRIVREAAEKLCNGRLVMVHEGGYSEAYVPFCGHAAIEELSGIKTGVEDPLLAFIRAQQPNDRLRTFQRQQLDELAISWGF
ncbi:class II histone deacetylase [Halomonas dongshanensis]|uniref:Class II histone deacetylase n=1 Tax=Halomonas dongshanensis TaxID=2890835 RepID=A0ABT2EAA8_9GAMM|nr:class II histone deacetylase [Halomonas dongshanensis]MCS2608030.1 class II histone deacetylase [Halomonas dongshanensis]